MTEFLILASLMDGTKTIYAIKKHIDENFTVFYKISLGAIHPSLAKLRILKLIALDEKMSSGGQKSSFYSITKKGKDYFVEIMNKPIDFNKKDSGQLADLKMILLPLLKNDEEAVLSVLEYLEYKKSLISNKNNEIFNVFLKEIDNKISFLENKRKKK